MSNTKALTITHVINNINRGGAETVLLNLVHELQKKESTLTITVLILEDQQYLRDEFDKHGIRVVLLPILHLPVKKQLIALYKYFRKEKPDIVHSHLLKSDLVALPAAFFAGVKKRFCTVHSMEKDRSKKERASRVAVSLFAQKIITVSESARTHAASLKRYPAKKMQTIYNAAGFVVSGVMPRDKRKGILSLIQVARLDEAKGQVYLLRAMKIAQDKGIECHLKIYGDGSQRSVLETLIKELSLTNVELAGTTNSVPEKLKEADLFIASSLWEGLPLAPIEAIAMGLPVIATDIPPHEEIFCQEERYPYLVPCKDPVAIVACIEAIMALSQTEYSALSALSLKLSKSFTLDTMISDYYNLYRG